MTSNLVASLGVGQKGSNSTSPTPRVVALLHKSNAIISYHRADKMGVDSEVIQAMSVINRNANSLTVTTAGIPIVEKGPETGTVERESRRCADALIQAHSTL